jgi:hypothetical protein
MFPLTSGVCFSNHEFFFSSRVLSRLLASLSCVELLLCLILRYVAQKPVEFLVEPFQEKSEVVVG